MDFKLLKAQILGLTPGCVQGTVQSYTALEGVPRGNAHICYTISYNPPLCERVLRGSLVENEPVTVSSMSMSLHAGVKVYRLLARCWSGLINVCCGPATRGDQMLTRRQCELHLLP